MRLLDWLRDGLLGERARMRRIGIDPDADMRQSVREDPSGPHHFGRRAHRPDPHAHYSFQNASHPPRH